MPTEFSKKDFINGLNWCFRNDKLVHFQVFPIETIEGELLQRVELDFKIKEMELKPLLFRTKKVVK
jgi:hypothetical protein